MIFLQASLSGPASQWVKQIPDDDFWTFAIILISLTIGGFIGAFYFFLRKRIIEDTPTSAIRSAAQGYVELSGIGKLIEGSIIPDLSLAPPAPGIATALRNIANQVKTVTG